MANLNINQFAQVPVRGQLDLQIQKSGVMQGQISVNQATALIAGDFVKFDTGISAGQFPQFLGAANSDSTMFAIAHNTKQDSYVAGDVADITIPPGPVIWCIGTGTINGGAVVESVGGSNTNVQTQATQKIRGIALDPSTVTGTLIRVLLANYTPA